jgi:hypothetical protein
MEENNQEMIYVGGLQTVTSCHGYIHKWGKVKYITCDTSYNEACNKDVYPEIII